MSANHGSSKAQISTANQPEQPIRVRDGPCVLRGILDWFCERNGEYVVLVRGASLERGRGSAQNSQHAAPRLFVDRGLIDQARFLQQTAASEQRALGEFIDVACDAENAREISQVAVFQPESEKNSGPD